MPSGASFLTHDQIAQQFLGYLKPITVGAAAYQRRRIQLPTGVHACTVEVLEDLCPRTQLGRGPRSVPFGGWQLSKLLAHRAVFDRSLRSRTLAVMHQPGSVRRHAIPDARSSPFLFTCADSSCPATQSSGRFSGAGRASRVGIRLLRRRSQRKGRLCSLLLSTAARDFPTLAARE